MTLARLPLRGIREDTAVFEDSALVAVLALDVPDAVDMPVFRRRAMLKALLRWVTTLRYPVQLCARTVNTGLASRLGILRARIEMRLRKDPKRDKKSMNDAIIALSRFCKWFGPHMRAEFEPQRLYYLTLQYAPVHKKKRDAKKLRNFAQHNALLAERVTEAIALLAKAGIKARRLSGDEVRRLYDSYFTFSFYTKKGTYLTMEDCVKQYLEAHHDIAEA